MKLLQNVVLTLAIGAACAMSVHAAAPAGASDRSTARQPTVVEQAKRYSAWSVARMLADPQAANLFARRLKADGKPVLLNAIAGELERAPGAANGAMRAEASRLRVVDQRVREYKSIAADSKNLMQVHLYVPKGYAGTVDWNRVLVAYAPSGKSREWAQVEAFDRQGRVHHLDARVAPSEPVLIAGIDRREDKRAGIAYLNRALRRAGMQSALPNGRAPLALDLSGKSTAQAAAAGIETSKLTHVSLKNDQEPWVSGAAEVFAIVSGVQPDQAKAELTVVDMPYLANDGTTYTPNQIMVFWSNYRYGAANIQLFEHDDDTNYKDLAVALSQGVTTLLGSFQPQYAVIAQVATAILQVMPASWFSNDDDYLDSFYTLEKGRSYVNYNGAAGNATISLAPYTLR